MNYLLVPDKFKGSLGAAQVIEALEKGITKADRDARFFSALLSDGGDGFLESIAQNKACEYRKVKASDPLGRSIEADYLFDAKTRTAYIEMAMTAGLELLEATDRNPLYTSTFGTGIQIKHALEEGAEAIYIGLGGSATNDAGMGIAVAMGYRFLDKEDNELEPIGLSLSKVHKIIAPKNSLADHGVEIYAVNDVNNPLYGEQGAAFVYAPQKGADTETVNALDEGLRHLDIQVQRDLGKDQADIPGAGAAGGTAYGLMVFLGAGFIGGTSFVLQTAGIPDLLTKQDIDFIITGEGKIDDQTLSGKLIQGIVELGKTHSVPVVAICGALATSEELLQKHGLQVVIEVGDSEKPLAYNMENASTLVEKAISDYFKEL